VCDHTDHVFQRQWKFESTKEMHVSYYSVLNYVLSELFIILPATTKMLGPMMDGKWSGNSFLLSSSPLLANHGGWVALFYYLLINNPQAGC